MKLINCKYRVLWEINSTTFVVRDLRDREQKTIRVPEPGVITDNLRDFFAEAYALYRSLRAPEIIKSLDFGPVHNIDGKKNCTQQYFMLSEYAGCESEEPFTEKLDGMTALPLFAQACRGAYYMHLKDMIHGSICPETVQINERAGEFFLRFKNPAAVELWRRGGGSNLYYAAPEAAFGRQESAVGDIYSLGVLLFRLLNGRGSKDFSADYAECKKRDGGGNEFILRLFPIIDKMTNPDPARRYSSVKDALDAVNGEFSTSFAAFDAAAVGQINPSIALIGHKPEEALITEAFDKIIAGTPGPRYICLHGGYGVGITALLKDLDHKWRLQSRLVYSAFGSSGDVLKPLLTQLMEDYNEHEAGLGIIRQVNAFIEGTKSEHATQNMLLKFIYDCVKDRPAVFIIDAAHLAGAETLDLFNKLMNVNKRVILLLAYRSDFENDIFSAFLKSLSGQRLEINLQPLSEEETVGYIRRKLSLPYDPSMFAKEVYNATHGNPLFIEEILKNLQHSELLTVDEQGQWYIDYSNEYGYSHIAMPSTIREVSSEQAGRLSDKERRLLETLSAFATPVTGKELAVCSGMDEKDVYAVVDVCVNLGYVSRTSSRLGQGYYLDFKMLRNFLYDGLSEQERLNLHERAAKVMEDRNDGAFLDQIVYHMKLAGRRDAALADNLLEIGKRLMSVGVLNRAINNFDGALELPGCDRVEILLNLGKAWQSAGILAKSLSYFRQAALEVKSNRVLYYRIKILSQCVGADDWILEELKRIFHEKPELKDGLREEYFGMLEAEARAESEDISKIISLAKSAYEKCPENLYDIRAGLLLSWGYGEHLDGNAGEATRVWETARPFLDKLTNMRYMTSLLNNLAAMSQYSNNFEASKQTILEGIDLCKQHGLLRNREFLLINLMDCHFRCAEFEKTIALAEEIAKLEEIQGDVTNWHLFKPYLLMDRYSEAREQATLIDAGKRKVGIYSGHSNVDLSAYPEYLAGRALFALRMGDDAEARFYLDKEADACENIELTDYDYHMFEPAYQAVMALKNGRQDKLPRIYESFLFLTEPHKDRQEVLYHLCCLLMLILDGGGLPALGEDFTEALARLKNAAAAPIVRAYYCYLQSTVQRGAERLENLREAQKLAKVYEQPLLLAKVYIALGSHFKNHNRFYSLHYYSEAQKATEKLLENVPPNYHNGFVSRHRLAVPAEELIEDADVWTSAKEANFARLPEKCETPEALVLLIGSGAEQNLSLIARFLAAVSYAERSEIITDHEESEFAAVASDDGDLGLTCPKHILRRVQKLEQDILVTSSGSYICVPVVLDNTLMGCIYLYASHRFNKLNNESLQMCKRLAPLAAVNIHQLKVKDGAFIDRLTGALNNKAFDRAFDAMIAGAGETGEGFSVILCDLDRFKSINDTYGHQVGDDILRAAGRIFRGCLSAEAHFGRIGGDEFAVLLPGMAAEQALETGKVMRRAVSDAMLLGSKRPVTISMGVSVYGLHGVSKIELKEKADMALYICKERGRNGTVLYEPEFNGGKMRRTHAMDGIVTADTLRDNERMRFMLSLIGLLRSPQPPGEKLRVMLNKMTEILHAETGVWLEASDSGFTISDISFSVSSAYSSAADAAGEAGKAYEKETAERAARERDWVLDEDGGIMSLYAPVIKGGKVKAVVCFAGKPGDTPFEAADGYYLKHLCGLAAMIN